MFFKTIGSKLRIKESALPRHTGIPRRKHESQLTSSEEKRKAETIVRLQQNQEPTSSRVDVVKKNLFLLEQRPSTRGKTLKTLPTKTVASPSGKFEVQAENVEQTSYVPPAQRIKVTRLGKSTQTVRPSLRSIGVNVDLKNIQLIKL